MNYFDSVREFLINLKEKIKRMFFYKNPIKYDENEVNELERNIIEKTRPNNFIEFPANVYKPNTIIIDGKEYIHYRMKFNSLHDLYTYLTNEPRVNKRVFRTLHSVDNGSDFAGIPYADAVEELENPPRAEYREFLELSEKLDEDVLGYVQEYISVKAPGGGAVDVPTYVTGNPFCFTTSRSVYTPKFIRVNIQLSYYHGTTKEQVFNKALIIAALVNAFEKSGYIVEVNTFEICKEANEIVDIDVNIKNNSQTFNKASLYKTLCYVEFLRRILFRVLETTDVHNDWYHGYGEPCDEDMVKKIKRLDENDIVFGEPKEIGVRGKDINEDFERVLSHLNLEDKIDVDRVKDEFKKEVASLKMTIK